MYKREEILDFLRANKDQLLSKYGLSKIGIFGSYAREEQTEKSDIDFIYEYEENPKDVFNKNYYLREFLKSTFKKEVDLCHEGSIKPRFKPYILKDAIYV